MVMMRLTLGPIFDPIDIKTLEIGKVYGSMKDGTAKVLYSVPYPHDTEIVTPKTLAYGLNWIQDAIPAPIPIPAQSSLAVVPFWLSVRYGRICDVIPVPWSILLKNTLLQISCQTCPEFKGHTGLAWWIGAVLTIVITTFTLFYFHWLFQHHIFLQTKLWLWIGPMASWDGHWPWV